MLLVLIWLLCSNACCYLWGCCYLRGCCYLWGCCCGLLWPDLYLRSGSTGSLWLAYSFLTYLSCTNLMMASIGLLAVGFLGSCAITWSSAPLRAAGATNIRLKLNSLTACSRANPYSKCQAWWTWLWWWKDRARGALQSNSCRRKLQNRERPLSYSKATARHFAVAVSAQRVLLQLQQPPDYLLLLLVSKHYKICFKLSKQTLLPSTSLPSAASLAPWGRFPPIKCHL